MGNSGEAGMILRGFILVIGLLSLPLSAATFDVNLFWEAPTTNENGTPLAQNQIQKYIIYFSNTEGELIAGERAKPSYTILVEQARESVTYEAAVDAGSSSSLYFAIAAVDVSGSASVLSPVLSLAVPSRPNPPTGFRATITFTSND